MTGEAVGFVIRRAITPNRVLRLLLVAALLDLDRPIRAIALERAIGLVIGRPHQLEPHILFWNVMHRLMTGLLATHRGIRVGDDLAGESDAHTAGFGQEIDAVLGLLLIAVGGICHGWAPLGV